MFGRFKKIVSLVISMALISYITMPSSGSSAEELTSSQRTERQLEEIIDTYGEENIIFDDGLSLYIGDEVELSAVTEDGSEIEYISNDDKVFEVINSKLIAKGEGVTFLIAKVKDKYHLSQVYVAEQEISTFAIDEKSIERESRGYYLVYVDAGHGGKDPGTVANGIREKDINLSIALKVSNKLQQKGVQVVMNRETDVFVDFKDTANHANSVNADVFVSIHSNSAVATSANGIETFYTKSIDVPYGKEIHSRLIKNTGAYDRGLKQDIYYVTNHTVMPAVLVESGFLTNATEASKLNTDAYQEKIANAIVDGVMEYLNNNVSINLIPAERISGPSRYETAIEIFNKGWETADTVVLVTGENYPDALSATPLAAKYDAPILLARNASLKYQAELSSVLKNKGVKNVIIIGSEGVIPKIIESELAQMGISSRRIAGSDRYETSLAIAKEIGINSGEIVIASGQNFPDGLSIASIAAQKEMPILLIREKYIPENIKG
ncbi:N-acetylmuramoyl-L-alanine amidase, partial [Clostridium saudiense]|nr:N-acetylmuramoyl-L-alanine amidase [Clostridium saudiense]